jgi:hypothetical protein
MRSIGFVHTFALIGPTGGRTLLASADLDDADVGLTLDRAADAVASRLERPEEHQAVRDAAERALLRVEEMPGTEAMAGERVPGDRLVRVFRHLAGEGPTG